MNIEDDCAVITDMPLSGEVVDFIEQRLRKGLSGADLEEWCDDNLDDLADIYGKYLTLNFSYIHAEMTLMFLQSVYDRDDVLDIVGSFVDNLI